jgi:hypothetical protein
MTVEEYKVFLNDVETTVQWITDNIEDAENALILITWIAKMLNQLQDNMEKLEEFKNKDKEKSE